MPERKVLVVAQMTIDGVAEFPASREEVGEDDTDYWESFHGGYWNSVDTLLLGRRTYQKWSSFWPEVRKRPDADKHMRQFSEFADRAEKVVFSRTLGSVSWEKSRLVAGDLSREVRQLKSRPGGDILIGGGPRLVQEFLREGLVDELRLVVYPTIAGRGKPLFNPDRMVDNPEDRIPLGAPLRHDFRLLEARPLKGSGGVVFLHYARASE
jgi:dihydrofolate reductase